MTDQDIQALELSRVWDAHNRGEEHSGAQSDAYLVVQSLETLDRATGLSDDQLTSIWNTVLSNAVDGLPVSFGLGAGNVRRSGSYLDTAISILTRYAWIIVAGMVGGFIAGISSRLTMRLAGLLTIDRNRFILTENDARVGELTLGGTLVLGAMGAAAGVLALFFYVLIKNRIPFTGWQRSSVFAILLLVVFGYVVMDPTNPDYQLFGPTWLNVFTFSSLYLVLGFCVVQIYEAGRNWNARHPGRFDSGVVAVLKVVIATLISVVGTIMLVPALFLGSGMLYIPVIAGVVWVVCKLASNTRISQIELPVIVRQWGIWVVPGIVGFILTARGIAGILTG